ncbi:MAG: hypothetical protein ACI87W_003455 [Halieaceae bacterium]|jgi:hypothetical protein
MNFVKFDMNMNMNMTFEFAEANIQFTADATEEQRQRYLQALERRVDAADAHFGGGNIVARWVQRKGATIGRDTRDGPESASIFVEWSSPESRDVTLAAFLDHWQSSIPDSPIVEQLQIEKGD